MVIICIYIRRGTFTTITFFFPLLCNIFVIAMILRKIFKNAKNPTGVVKVTLLNSSPTVDKFR